MDEETRVFLHVAGIAEPFNVISELFLKELRWFESQYRHIYTYIFWCFILMLVIGLCPNLYFSACSKYVYSTQLWIYTEISILTQLLTDFMNVSNRMFLFINYSLWVVYSLFRNFRGSPELKWAPCGPFQFWLPTKLHKTALTHRE